MGSRRRAPSGSVAAHPLDDRRRADALSTSTISSAPSGQSVVDEVLEAVDRVVAAVVVHDHDPDPRLARTSARPVIARCLSGSHHGAVVAVPGDGRLERLAELALRRPAERSHLRGVDRVAAVVAEAVLDVLDHRLVVAEDLEDACR